MRSFWLNAEMSRSTSANARPIDYVLRVAAPQFHREVDRTLTRVAREIEGVEADARRLQNAGDRHLVDGQHEHVSILVRQALASRRLRFAGERPIARLTAIALRATWRCPGLYLVCRALRDGYSVTGAVGESRSAAVQRTQRGRIPRRLNPQAGSEPCRNSTGAITAPREGLRPSRAGRSMNRNRTSWD